MPDSWTTNIPSVLDNPSAWDRIQIGPVVAPGYCNALSVKRAHDVTFSKPGGQDGETIKVNGQKLAQVWITITWWDDETGKNRAAYEQLLELLFPLVGSPNAVDVIHPKLQAHKLQKLFVHELSDEELPLAETGVMRLSLHCANYRPPKKKVPSVGGKPAVPDVSKEVKPFFPYEMALAYKETGYAGSPGAPYTAPAHGIAAIVGADTSASDAIAPPAKPKP